MLTRRQLISLFLGSAAANAVSARIEPFKINSDPNILRIAFGSCVSQRKEQKIWEHIATKNPHLFLMMGDGVYPEHEGEDLAILESIERAYQQARLRDELALFRKKVKTIAIWDDNDYGGSDIGASFEFKCRSRELFLEFWTKNSEAITRRRNSGIYGLWEFGTSNQRTQIIVPDLRFCRSEWAQTETSVRRTLSESGFGPYKPILDDTVTMLGEEQWLWLERCLRRPANLRLLVSSIQLVPEGRGWESWSNFPTEKQRLLDLIRTTKADGVFVLSGDTHYAEISRDDDSGVGYPLWEVTSSGLTEYWPTPGPNPNRIGPAYPEKNFGLLTVNWVSAEPMLVAEIFGENGQRLRQQSILLNSLSASSGGVVNRFDLT